MYVYGSPVVVGAWCFYNRLSSNVPPDQTYKCSHRNGYQTNDDSLATQAYGSCFIINRDTITADQLSAPCISTSGFSLVDSGDAVKIWPSNGIALLLWQLGCRGVGGEVGAVCSTHSSLFAALIAAWGDCTSSVDDRIADGHQLQLEFFQFHGSRLYPCVTCPWNGLCTPHVWPSFFNRAFPFDPTKLSRWTYRD